MKSITKRFALASSLLALLVLTAGCGDPVTGPTTGPMPDFHLDDVNPASATFGDSVSPRQYTGVISAWYFGHST